MRIYLNLSLFMRMRLTVSGTLHVEHIWVSSLFRRCEWVMRVWRVSLLSYFFCSLPATHLGYLVYGRACFIFDHSKIFCNLFSMNLLMNSFKSMYGIFALHMSIRRAFRQLGLPFHFHVYQCEVVSRWDPPSQFCSRHGYIPLDKTIRPPSKMKKQILFRIFKLWKSDIWKIRLRDI